MVLVAVMVLLVFLFHVESLSNCETRYVFLCHETCIPLTKLVSKLSLNLCCWAGPGHHFTCIECATHIVLVCILFICALQYNVICYDPYSSLIPVAISECVVSAILLEMPN